MKNQIMLITYADSMGGNLAALRRVLHRYFAGCIGSVHILPFFPSSADRGFAPICYDRVDPQFGTYADIRALSGDYDLMFDFMINHLSRQSPQFRDFAAKKDASSYRDFFIRTAKFWPDGVPTAAQRDAVYKRKPRAPETEIAFADGSRETLWCTFGEEQIDLNLDSPAVRTFIRENLACLCRHGASMIRLDAFAYAIKKPGGSCFFEEPDIWTLLEWVSRITAPYNVELLPEVHEKSDIQMKLAERGWWIYDFALPMLTLHAIYACDGQYLCDWLARSPNRQFTTLDTHDGIGVVDVRGLLPDDAIDFTQAQLFTRGANVKRVYNTAAYGNLDLYQINTTYYAALGGDDDAYLLARAIQFFAKGIPQVYYVGLLAGENDTALLERTRNGRDINRHNYTESEIDDTVRRPVVVRLQELMRFRNTHPAFALEGTLEIAQPRPSEIVLTRRNGTHWARLEADLAARRFRITKSG